MSKTPIAIIILDGYGYGANNKYNAIEVAKTPYIDSLLANYPNTTLSASGGDVGLPDGQIGNSEVGHLNIGAGRIVYQDLSLIMNSAKSGEIFENEAYLGAMKACAEKGTALHLMGLLSDGGVHSHIEILYAIIEMAKRQGLEKVYIHAFLDGRDVGPTTGAEFIRSCEAKCAEIGCGKIGTVQGRFYAMDRDKRWERVEKAYNAMVFGEADIATNPAEAVEAHYKNEIYDEFVPPMICDENAKISANDSVIFINFRPDRAREITEALTEEAFTGFERKGGMLPLNYVCTTQYNERYTWLKTAFPPKQVTNGMGEYLSKKGYTQLRIAETEKYAHVTFFMDGGVETDFEGMTKELIPSSKEFPTYDLIPEMSAYQVAEKAVEYINEGKQDVIVLNFANCDMVGHTGIVEAAVKATEVVDECLSKVVEAMKAKNGICFILSDHGNAESMYDEVENTPQTAHTTNPVPFIVVGKDVKLEAGKLCDVVPTVFDVMGLEKPVEMTGKSLIN